MTTYPSPRRRRQAAFTLTEVMITMTIVAAALAMTMSTVTFVMRSMYKDNERLATNANLRYLISQVSQETLDATEFYIFENYQALDGTVDLATDVTANTTTSFGVTIYHGDCLVLVTRVSLDSAAAIRRIRIYYRPATSPNTEAAIRYYRGTDYGVSSTQTNLITLLNAVNLRTNPQISGSTVIAKRAIGRAKNSARSSFYPVFSSEFPTISKTNESVSLNVELINGSSVTNLLSSSSFNYTISPRR